MTDLEKARRIAEWKGPCFAMPCCGKDGWACNECPIDRHLDDWQGQARAILEKYEEEK